ncbi:hypothetical protein OAP56_00210 [Rickettsiaceae bacterium]|nr:hypothetical protein [Rickettsiaceae bacterium]
MYQLIIHHDTGLKRESDQLHKDERSPGHVYLEVTNGEDNLIYGILSGIDFNLMRPINTYNTYGEYHVHGSERLELAREYEIQNPNDKILHSKSIEITEEQYFEGIILLNEYEPYIGKQVPSQTYGFVFNNCAHFVNHVYKGMGLEGDYVRNYTTSELGIINTALTNKYDRLDLHAGDKSFIAGGLTREEVANKYNLPVDMLSEIERPQDSLQSMLYTQTLQQFGAHAASKVEDKYFIIAANPKLLSQNPSDQNTSHQEEHSQNQFNYPMPEANQRINELLNNPEKLAQHQQMSMQMAMDAIKQSNQYMPSFYQQMQEQQNMYQNQYASFLPGMNNPVHQEGFARAQSFLSNMGMHPPTYQGFAAGNTKTTNNPSSQQSYQEESKKSEEDLKPKVETKSKKEKEQNNNTLAGSNLINDFASLEIIDRQEELGSQCLGKLDDENDSNLSS